MEFSYGDGEYQESQTQCQGKIILSEHKLYLKGPQGDLASTFIPLEKIEKIKRGKNGIEIYVRPTLTLRYCAVINGEGRYLDDLVKDLVSRRGLKKKFLRQEWIEIPH